MQKVKPDVPPSSCFTSMQGLGGGGSKNARALDGRRPGLRARLTLHHKSAALAGASASEGAGPSCGGDPRLRAGQRINPLGTGGREPDWGPASCFSRISQWAKDATRLAGGVGLLGK